MNWNGKKFNPLGEIETKPFYPNASRQMELVSDFSWIPFEERIEILSKAVSSRVEELQEMELEQKKQVIKICFFRLKSTTTCHAFGWILNVFLP